MPIYEYRCSSCDHRFEVFRKVSDASSNDKCPKCKKPAKRVFHPVGVIYKGSGFHSTDYKKKNSVPDNASGKESSSGSSESTDPVVQKRIDTA